MSHSESRWTHDICGACWNKRNPDKPLHPEDAGQGDLEVCCFCGSETCDGIPIRADISETPFCPRRAGQ